MGQISVSLEDNLIVVDFEEEADYFEKADLKISTIYEAVTYPCCSNEACRKKKLQNKRCVICLEEVKTGSKGCRVVVDIDDVNTSKTTKITLSNALVMLVFGITEDDLADDDKLVSLLCIKLPVTFKAKVSDNRLYVIDIE
ncbi:uncharacterized protein LOC117329813 [Pecten maximus]|uniref:uncharacterized protein LOC117329813 n=1 Tax=Pecten maximus TaxID=6579 RepID=UPI0014581AF1|nr:uncharacterized protein LOC117329813 [Pecten maximus]